MSVTRMRGCIATHLAAFSRSWKGAVSLEFFSGFCGVSIHQTSWRPSRFRAISEICLCPSWAGLKDPPSRPILREPKDHIRARFDIEGATSTRASRPVFSAECAGGKHESAGASWVDVTDDTDQRPLRRT